MGLRPTFNPHLVPTSDLPTLSNVMDPNLVSNSHDGILHVQINSEAQKWGGGGPTSIMKRNGEGPQSASMLSVLSLADRIHMYINMYCFRAKRVWASC